MKLVLKLNHFYVETADEGVFEAIVQDPVIASARANDEGEKQLLCAWNVVGVC